MSTAARGFERVAAIAKARGAEQIVVGLPRNMDGSEGESAQNAPPSGAELHALCGLPVDFFRRARHNGYGAQFPERDEHARQKRKAAVDAVAATIILQDYLDFRRNRKGNLHKIKVDKTGSVLYTK